MAASISDVGPFCPRVRGCWLMGWLCGRWWGQLLDKLPDAPGLPWARYALALQVPLP